ncbi:MAG: 50S ribosomal protein L10 [Candidatus Nealsonbacteria bacterium RIFCSPHIGHO2_01_FULL_43_31]|uniref:Large ribosomal subunit protein uL10 n=2 Tax=Candidatus Nealsoniibacteriota TaxID=1817911 RepID=A0A1G2E3D5_9BACT|nr:MAG: 50S ribosomal protein L10 [Parcubacteria group bacterium GW2011_GWB1_43_6]OGZ20179.1 MAG: 50S ribosomal protein L10 [Candidatus Nealsonbacteria bacterium RIFCSPHIGHO2_01_FULL_43_31]
MSTDKAFFYMALTKTQKGKILNDLKEKVEKQKAIVFAAITGLKVKDLSSLRKLMRSKDCELKVAKKTLISKAFQGKKIEFDVKKLEGEVALGFGYKDEVLPFKTIYDFAKDHENLKILGGIMGVEVLDKSKALEFGQMPTRDELLTRLMANILRGGLRNLVYALSQINK